MRLPSPVQNIDELVKSLSKVRHIDLTTVAVAWAENTLEKHNLMRWKKRLRNPTTSIRTRCQIVIESADFWAIVEQIGEADF
jgi:hypothetical protein